MATRERKATRSNTDSPTISNSSSRSDTASPVTAGRTKKTEATTPVRNAGRSTRAGSVAQGGSPPDELEPPTIAAAVAVVVDGEKDAAGEEAVTAAKNPRSRPTRQTTAAAEEEKTPTRGIRKVVATANQKRNSLPILGRAAKMTTRRNSSGRMEAILKACKEDDSGQLVTKVKRGRAAAAAATTTTPADRRPLLRRKRVLSAEEARKTVPNDDEEGVEDEGEKTKAEKVLKLDETAMSDSEVSKVGRRTSVDSVASKCSEATDHSHGSEDTPTAIEGEQVKDEPMDADADELGAEVEEKGKVRGRPGRKRKRGGAAGKRNSPVKASILTAEESPAVDKKEGAEKSEVEAAKVKDGGEKDEDGSAVLEEKEAELKSDLEEKELNGKDSKEGESVPAEQEEEAGKANVNGELSIKVEPVDGEQSKGVETQKESSPSPNLPQSLSPVSVQQICGQPAFLENNPGIEKDPTLAGMVQEQEKLAKRVDEGLAEVKGAEKEEKRVAEDEDGKENQSVNPPAVKTPPPKDVSEGAADEGNKEEKDLSVKQIKAEPESPECSSKKENHLKVLGLLTLRAASQAKHEKARRREILKAFPTPPSINLQSAGGESDGGGSGSGKVARSTSQPEYTGTLKTVIKLNRKNGNGASSSKGSGGGSTTTTTTAGGRQSLKMTFQKGRAKGGHSLNGAAGGVGKDSRNSASEGEEYYTISKEGNSLGQTQTATGETGTQQGQDPPGRKTNNRSQSTADCGGSTHSGEGGEGGSGKPEKDILIPEKASSFSIHPDRLCQDQCFYCGGKFGLFDTPLHIAQIKSQERQKKILDNEEKLTADSCLCDACYRHVDRRANCPSYKKRLSAPASLLRQRSIMNNNTHQDEAMDVDDQMQGKVGGEGAMKRNRSVGPNCSLCRGKISKNRSFPLNQNVKRLEDMIRNQGIPVQWGITPVVCKLCKFYTERLMKELRGELPENNSFAENYRRRLLSLYKSEEVQRKKQRQGEAQGRQQQAMSGKAQSNAASMDSDASRALSRNPAISIRELFPGEDEMGLSVQFPFGQAGGLRTPEGWTRSCSLLQYDDATRQLWDELQRPYGNQSSFIRHLVLLEKYFRNGDLVLSKNASNSAATYSESVQTRLRAFDSISTQNRSLLKQLSNAPITITQKTAPKKQPQTQNVTTASVFYPPGPSIAATVPSGSKLEAGASLLKKTNSTMPPDLISITPSKAATLNTTTATSGGGSTSASTAGSTSTAAPGPSTSTAAGGSSTTTPPVPSPSKKTIEGANKTKDNGKVVVVELSLTMSPQDRKMVNGKSWRPTLLPFETIEANEDGTRSMYKTADGRVLPSRVQVMSGGKPYHISIHDYNILCILRKEKLALKAIKAQSAQGNGAAETSTSTSVTPANPPVSVAAPVNKPQQQQIPTQPMLPQIPNNILEQNSFIPVTQSGIISLNHSNGSMSVTASGGGGTVTSGNGQRRNSKTGQSSTAGGANVLSLGSQITATVSGAEKEPPKLAAHNWMWNPGDLSMEPRVPFNPPVDNNNPATTALKARAATANATAAALLSRIPKSLTVIPQQKLM